MPTFTFTLNGSITAVDGLDQKSLTLAAPVLWRYSS